MQKQKQKYFFSDEFTLIKHVSIIFQMLYEENGAVADFLCRILTSNLHIFSSRKVLLSVNTSNKTYCVCTCIQEVVLSPTASSYSMPQLTGSTEYNVKLQAIAGAQRSRHVSTVFTTSKDDNMCNTIFYCLWSLPRIN